MVKVFINNVDDLKKKTAGRLYFCPEKNLSPFGLLFPLKANSVNLLSSCALKNSLEDNYVGL